eukprot:SAG31_NODE_7604_length_1643_cov_1.443005_1_plen_320_part_10
MADSSSALPDCELSDAAYAPLLNHPENQGFRGSRVLGRRPDSESHDFGAFEPEPEMASPRARDRISFSESVSRVSASSAASSAASSVSASCRDWWVTPQQFIDDEEQRGLAMRHSLLSVVCPRILMVLPTLLYLLGIWAYFYSSASANCFIGLKNTGSGQHSNWSWVDGAPYDPDTVQWATGEDGPDSRSRVAALLHIGVLDSPDNDSPFHEKVYGVGTTDPVVGGLLFGETATESHVGELFWPLCQNNVTMLYDEVDSSEQIWIVADDEASEADLISNMWKRAKQLCERRGHLATVVGRTNMTSATQKCEKRLAGPHKA